MRKKNEEDEKRRLKEKRVNERGERREKSETSSEETKRG